MSKSVKLLVSWMPTANDLRASTTLASEAPDQGTDGSMFLKFAKMVSEKCMTLSVWPRAPSKYACGNALSQVRTESAECTFSTLMTGRPLAVRKSRTVLFRVRLDTND